jgi:hypothetical protein
MRLSLSQQGQFRSDLPCCMCVCMVVKHGGGRRCVARDCVKACQPNYDYCPDHFIAVTLQVLDQ